MATSPTQKTTPAEGAYTAAEKPAAKATQKTQGIRAVYGRMCDPHTTLEYSQIPTELLKKSGWIDSQLAAGKMELVDL